MTDDLISRQAAIDIERNATVDTNPSHFEAHQKFTQFMDDAEISSFGRWQWSNGFNTALTAVGIDLKKLPSAQKTGKWVHLGGDEWCCSACGEVEHTEGSWEHPLKDREWKYCRTCGAKMYETQKKPCDDCQEFDCYGCEYSERKYE